MSGGHYNYVCIAEDSDLVARRHSDLHDLVHDLIMEFPASLAAVHSRWLLDDLSKWMIDLDQRVQRLRDVWHAVEWWASNDYGREQVLTAILTYEDAEVNKNARHEQLRALLADDALRAAPGEILARRIDQLIRKWEEPT